MRQFYCPDIVAGFPLSGRYIENVNNLENSFIK